MGDTSARIPANSTGDLDRAKQIFEDITNCAKVRTTVFEAFAKQAIYDINNSKTEVIYDQRELSCKTTR